MIGLWLILNLSRGDRSDPYAEDYILAAIRFSKSVLPFISNLSSNFTQYFLQDIAGVSSGYSVRFYELMMQFKVQVIEK